MTDVDEQVTHQVDLYGDGACRGNPGPGGWGVLLRCGDKDRELLGSELMTTNNRMELTAVIEGLRALKRPCEVRVYTDSRYVCDGMREWVTAWKARGWKTAQRQPVKNMDLWQALDAEQQKHQVSWHWIRGHAGHVENEHVDKLANLAIDRMQKDGSQ